MPVNQVPVGDAVVLTAEQFAESKHELPEGGRWVELVAGEIVSLQPPELLHGAAVLNLSKAFAEYLGRSGEGYACYELGLIVARNPDTVRCPPISYFLGGHRFAEADKVVTDVKPALIVDIASTKDRRRDMSRRVDEFLGWGVELVWVADSVEKRFEVFRPGEPRQSLEEDQWLDGRPDPTDAILPGFRIRVADVFAEPEWWTGRRAYGHK